MIRHKVYLFIWIALMGGTCALKAQTQPSPELLKSKILFDERNYPEAEDILSQIGKGAPDYSEAQYYLGRIAVEQKAYDKSIQRFENATKAKPAVVEYHNWLGVMYGVVAM